MKPPIDAVLDAVPKWQQRCLVDGFGLYVDEPVWTSAAFDDLKKHSIAAPDAGRSGMRCFFGAACLVP